MKKKNFVLLLGIIFFSGSFNMLIACHSCGCPSLLLATFIAADEEVLSEEARPIETLPPEPAVPSIEVPPIKALPVVRQEIKEIYVPEGKEIILSVYTVKKGDYLSKIAKREYGDKDLWKVIYEYNKFIKNPHWIFPGDKIILPKIVYKLPEVPEIVEEPLKEKEVKVPRIYKDFIAPYDFEFSAIIIGFTVNKYFQAQGDSVFIDIGREDGIKENQRLSIYRRGHSVIHPHTKENLGNVYEKIGVLRVTSDIEEYTSTAIVIYSDRHIKKEDALILAE